MKKLFNLSKPLLLSIITLLFVSGFLRYYLAINSGQLLLEFKNQNFREIYSMDTLKLSSRLNALSSAINWVCIEGSIDGRSFYKMERGTCKTGIIKHRQELHILQANNIHLSFTTRLPKEVEQLFVIFFVMQIILISALIKSTRKAEEEKREQELSLTRLARQMSHDIRSPLATLDSVLSNSKGLPPDEMALLKKSVSRINEIAESLLKNSRSSFVLSQIDLKNSLESIVFEKQIEFQSRPQLNINMEMDSHSQHVLINEMEFKRIISNLINNSIEAEAGHISLKLSANGNEAKIQIIDNGHGISADIISKIGKQNLTTKNKGSGLGLTHCAETLKAWGGNFVIDSTEKLGTKIEISIPLIEASKKAVLIDDDELVKLTWSASARKNGIELITASSLNDIDLTSLHKDVTFYIDSDLGRNQTPGEIVAKHLHENGYTNIFMATGYVDEDFSDLMFLKGVLTKTPPF